MAYYMAIYWPTIIDNGKLQPYLTAFYNPIVFWFVVFYYASCTMLDNIFEMNILLAVAFQMSSISALSGLCIYHDGFMFSIK